MFFRVRVDEHPPPREYGFIKLTFTILAVATFLASMYLRPTLVRILSSVVAATSLRRSSIICLLDLKAKTSNKMPYIATTRPRMVQCLLDPASDAQRGCAKKN